jgi:hypothetical protein
MSDALVRPSGLKPGWRGPATSCEQPRAAISSRAQTGLYCARPGRCVSPNRAMRAAARSKIRRRGTERSAQHRAAASNREESGAAEHAGGMPRHARHESSAGLIETLKLRRCPGES